MEKINAGPAYISAPILTTQRIHVLAHFYFLFFFSLFNPFALREKCNWEIWKIFAYVYVFLSRGKHVTKTRETVQICQTSSKRFNLTPRAQMLSIFLGATQPRPVTHNLWLMMTQRETGTDRVCASEGKVKREREMGGTRLSWIQAKLNWELWVTFELDQLMRRINSTRQILRTTHTHTLALAHLCAYLSSCQNAWNSLQIWWAAGETRRQQVGNNVMRHVGEHRASVCVCV